MSTRSPTRLILLLGALIASACGSDAPDARFIDDFIARSGLVDCRPAPIAGRGEVLDAVALGDTALLALYGPTRELVAYDARLRPAHVIPLAREGPAGVSEPVSAALGRDGIAYIADRGGRALKRLDLRRGADRGTIRLPFAPHRVRTGGAGRVLVTPLVLGDEPSWLLYAIDDVEAGSGDGADDVGEEGEPEPTPVRVPPTRYADLTVNALANMAVPAAMPDGAVIAAHQFLVPVAFRAAAPNVAPVRHALPLPDGVRATVGRVPTTPITEERLGEITTAATALSVDRARGGLLYLTRTGRRPGDGASEKAIVRLDHELAYERSYILDVNATQLAYLADRGIALVADEEGTWHSCPTP